MKKIFVKLYAGLQELGNGQQGQDLVEYGLLIGVIALTCIAVVSPLAAYVNEALSSVNTSLV